MIIKKINTIKKQEKAAADSLLFFAGWGMDERPFLEYLPVDKDCMICYDYRSLSFDDSLLAPYRQIRVVAWSMGVWAASRILSGRNLPVSESIAVNGTPWPIDDERGIATAVFRGTLEGLNEDTLQKFRKRMCGSKEALEHFMKHVPLRTTEDLHEELTLIGKLYAMQVNTGEAYPACFTGESSREIQHPPHAHKPPFEWNKIYIGMQDKIFPVTNQQTAWEGKNITTVHCAHYPYTLWPELFAKEKRADG